MTGLGIITVLMALLPLLPAAVSGPTTRATLTVEVKNNTRDGATVVGDEVTLQRFQGQAQIDSLPAKVSADGKAVFTNVPTGPQMAAVARVKHQNMAFGSQPVSLESAVEGLSAHVEVFDVSTDASQLSVGIHHVMVAARGRMLEFTEYLQLNNASDKAIAGAERDDQNRPIVVKILLPAGFRDLTASSYLEEEALVVTPDGFHDTMAVPPGEHQVAFSYKVDIGRGAVKVTKGITLPTAELLVFWERGQGKLEGLGEPNDRLVNAEGVPIEYYRRSGLKPGETVAFEISGLNVPKSEASTWVILAVAFAVIGIVAMVRLRPKSPGSRRKRG